MGITLKATVARDFKIQRIYDALTKASKESLKEAEKEFDRTVKTWKHKPKFNIKITPMLMTLTTKRFEASITTKDKIYRYVNYGTKRHEIKAKKEDGMLVFTVGSKPKTTPGTLDASAGSDSGKTGAAKKVMHPGIKARRFDLIVEKKWKPKWRDRMQKAMSEGAKQSGHGR